MRRFATSAAAFVALSAFCACALPAGAATKKLQQPVVERSAAGTVIQPTTTIIPDGNGHRTIIIIPRQRSYLDTGTEVSAILAGLIGSPAPITRATAATRWRAPSIFLDSTPPPRFK
jgi:hypothetical protein